MITKDMVKRGYQRGIITLDIDPNMESGTIARIADDWFYFGGFTAADMNPKEYKKNIPEEDIIREIFEVLDEFKTESPDEYAYCEAILRESDSYWNEIRCTYLNEENMFWSVDAWTSGDDSEECTVIAYIDDITGRIIYNDPVARIDTYAQEVIQNKLREINKLMDIVKKTANIEIAINTHHGRLIADLEPDELTGAGYDAIYVGLQPSADPYIYCDLAAVRSHKAENIVDILTWQNIWDENYTTKTPIPGSEIQDLVDTCRDE